MLHLAKKFFRWHTDVDFSFFSGAHVVGLPAFRNTSLRNTFFPLIPLHLWSIAPSHVFHYRTEPTSMSNVFLGLILFTPTIISSSRQSKSVPLGFCGFSLSVGSTALLRRLIHQLHAFASISTCDFSGEHEGIGWPSIKE